MRLLWAGVHATSAMWGWPRDQTGSIHQLAAPVVVACSETHANVHSKVPTCRASGQSHDQQTRFGWCPEPCCAALRCAVPCVCRLPFLSAISIKMHTDSQHGDLDPVLAQMHMHATCLHSLSLQLATSWAGDAATWASLGKVVSLTKLHINFCRVRPECTTVSFSSLGGSSMALC